MDLTLLQCYEFVLIPFPQFLSHEWHSFDQGLQPVQKWRKIILTMSFRVKLMTHC